MTNDKYEITDIAHPEYPWLHRIRALQDVGKDVKKGDLGGYVESESNLSFEPKDNACSTMIPSPAIQRMCVRTAASTKNPWQRTKRISPKAPA